jgi:preprotein translocase subunit YajC
MGGVIVWMLMGMLFLVPGAFMMFREQKKKKEDRNGALLWTGIGLMGIGVVLCGGAGLGTIMTGIGAAAE